MQPATTLQASIFQDENPPTERRLASPPRPNPGRRGGREHPLDALPGRVQRLTRTPALAHQPRALATDSGPGQSRSTLRRRRKGARARDFHSRPAFPAARGRGLRDGVMGRGLGAAGSGRESMEVQENGAVQDAAPVASKASSSAGHYELPWGIDVVRNKIKMFAQQKVTLPKGRHKIIILDEADSMTDGAQQALRRTMEIYSKTTRFALACNASDKIIEPIQSRCAVLRYTKLTDAQILARLLNVIEKEQVPHTDDGLEAIIFTAQGDMRQALNNLQSTFSGFGFINSENVFKVCDEPHPLLVKEMIQHCVNANIDEAYKILAHLWHLGYSPEDIIGNIFRVCKTFQMAEYLKLEFIKEIGYTHMKVAGGVNSLLQMAGLAGQAVQEDNGPGGQFRAESPRVLCDWPGVPVPAVGEPRPWGRRHHRGQETPRVCACACVCVRAHVCRHVPSQLIKPHRVCQQGGQACLLSLCALALHR
uniref:Replication factor C subunit 2 n=1 Tax=Oryctolagus cuniculus TaxID=9986 RepID=A0A5F9DPW7_RABIT